MKPAGGGIFKCTTVVDIDVFDSHVDVVPKNTNVEVEFRIGKTYGTAFAEIDGKTIHFEVKRSEVDWIKESGEAAGR